MYLKKRFCLSVAILLIVILFSGCEGAPFAPDFSCRQAFTLAMTAEIGGKPSEGVLTCRSYEELEISFTSPPSLAPFSVRTEGENFAVDVGGVTDTVGAGTWPPDAPLRVLLDAARTAVFTNHGAWVYDKANDRFTAALTVNGTPVTVTCGRDGYLQSFSSTRLTATFTPMEESGG